MLLLPPFLSARAVIFWCLTEIKDDTGSFAQIILHAKGGSHHVTLFYASPRSRCVDGSGDVRRHSAVLFDHGCPPR